MVFTLGLTWGGTFLVIELALREWPPFWVASGRIVFGALIMVAIWRAQGLRLFKVKPDVTTCASVLALSAFSTGIPFV